MPRWGEGVVPELERHAGLARPRWQHSGQRRQCDDDRTNGLTITNNSAACQAARGPRNPRAWQERACSPANAAQLRESEHHHVHRVLRVVGLQHLETRLRHAIAAAWAPEHYQHMPGQQQARAAPAAEQAAGSACQSRCIMSRHGMSEDGEESSSGTIPMITIRQHVYAGQAGH